MNRDKSLTDVYTQYPVGCRVEYVGDAVAVPAFARGKVIWHHEPASRQAQAGRPLRVAFTIDATNDTVTALDVNPVDVLPI